MDKYKNNNSKFSKEIIGIWKKKEMIGLMMNAGR